MKYEIPTIIKQDRVSIVNMSSIYDLRGYIHNRDYSAQACRYWITKSAALQYTKQGIRVNAICSAFIDTPLLDFITNDPDALEDLIALHPIGRLGTPDEIAEAVVWLCSDAASFVTGHSLAAHGGFLL